MDVQQKDHLNSHWFDDAIYWFVSAEHRDVFAADPDTMLRNMVAFVRSHWPMALLSIRILKHG